MDDTPGLGIAIILSLAMAAIGFFGAIPVPEVPSNGGVCLPTPATWNIPQLWALIGGTGLLLITALMLFSVNTRYNLEPGSQATAASFFVFSTAAILPLTQRFSSSVIMAFVTLICLRGLFAHYNRRDTSRSMFISTSTLALASMIDYSFLPLIIPVYISAAILKELNFRSFLGGLFGIAAPYIVVFGLNILQLSDLRPPILDWTFNPGNLLEIQIAAAVALLASMILLLRETTVANMRNTRTKLFNAVINCWLICTSAYMIADFTNITAYLATANLLLGLRLGGLIGDRKFNARGIIYFVTLVIYGAVFTMQIVL